MSEETIKSLLTEERSFPPPADFVKRANAKDESIYEEGKNPEAFWENRAKELTWFKPWDKVLEWDLPFSKWFVGGKTNITVNCLDRHVEAGRGDKVAFYFEGEPGDRKAWTYAELLTEVKKFANVLKGLGVEKGDRVTLYLGMTIELPIAMLACARIGAAHTIVFGGFSPDSIRDRVEDSQSKVVVTADGGWRRGNVVPLKANIDKALEGSTPIQKCVVVKRTGDALPIEMQEGRDLWWHELMADASDDCPPEEMDAEDLLFILYTSGTTGKPKGIAHTTGGYMVGAATTTKYVFDLHDDDIYWCTADIGWITGHSYITYGPLMNGATGVIFEGAPNFPDKGRFWDIIQHYKVTIFYTAPTAIRAFMGWGTEWPEKYDLSSLRLLGSVGEPINPEAWMWYHEVIGHEKCPIVDTWWQTETGAIMITPLPGVTTTKPGSACRAFPGIDVAVVDEDGKEVGPGGGGFLVIKSPWPSMLRTVYGDDERYKQVYWSRFPHLYFTGDGCKVDEDGYLWLMGRVDDIMLVAGHNISTAEVESALVSHETVAESAVVGRPDPVKGQAISAFVTLKQGVDSSDELLKELRNHVATKLGPIAKPAEIHFTADLPKTRSGKIMRRLLRDIAGGKTLGDTTTLADPSVVESLRAQYEKQES